MNPLLNLNALGMSRLVALGVTGLVLVALIFFGVRNLAAPTYVTLYSGLTYASAGRIVDALEQEGFSVEVAGGGSSVRVPSEDVPRARMALAERGMPGEGVPGWELFDDMSGFGMNTFMQQVNRLRALEGEIARSIRTIEGIDGARVHLVLPEREAFSRTRPEPSASIVLQLRPSAQIGRRQALAIRALVASAVPDLAPNRVAILSATGEAILSDLDSQVSPLDGMTSALEERLTRNLMDVLSARVGAGNVRISVNVSLESERRVVRSTSFDPNQQVPRSVEQTEESREDRSGGLPSVDIGQNLPPGVGTQGGDSGGSESRTTRSSTVSNFEIGSMLEERVREPGDVRRVSVAVLVNGLATRAADGSIVQEDRPRDELERLAELVRSAIGYDATRGDIVTVDSLRFADYATDIAMLPEPGIADQILANLPLILKGIFILALVLLVLLLGVRPILRNLLPAAPEPGPTPGVSGAPTSVGAPPPMAPREATFVATGTTNFPPGTDRHEDDTSLVSLAQVDGALHKGWITSLSELVASDPDGAMRVLQTWLAEED